MLGRLLSPLPGMCCSGTVAFQIASLQNAQLVPAAGGCESECIVALASQGAAFTALRLSQLGQGLLPHFDGLPFLLDDIFFKFFFSATSPSTPAVPDPKSAL
jgi:hypothetical protein